MCRILCGIAQNFPPTAVGDQRRRLWNPASLYKGLSETFNPTKNRVETNFLWRVFMKEFKQKVSVTLDCSLVIDLKKQAREEGRSFSQLLNMILKAYLASKKEVQF